MILWCTTSILFVIITNFSASADILIDNDGGYKNIIIGISPNLQKSEVELQISQLKVLFRNSSEALFVASQKKVFFKEIIFAFPKEYETWISSSSLLDSNDTKSFRKPNVFITDDDIFQNPYTIQHRGCAKPGLRINIPSDFLMKKSYYKKASSLVRQWAHYLYGVFDESGFSNDFLYPACYRIPGSDKMRVSDCTNERAVYEFEKNSRRGYDSFPSTCTPVPVSDKNDHIVSSIMTNIDFPEMRYFCDDDTRPHNRNAPTKQNALCREKSTWEIISSHDDFKFERKETKNIRPGFKYVVESNPNFVVAVDTSTEMDLNDRMALTLNAFKYFVLYDLPKNSTVRLIDMKGKDDIIEIKNIMSEEDTRKIIDMFPETEGKGDICVHCTIQRLLEDLKLDINDIIIITATDITSSRIDDITTILKSNKVALHVLYFKKDLRHAPFLEKVAQVSGGSFYYIPDVFPTGSRISSLTKLYEAFRSILESFSWLNRKHVLVDQMTFTENCSPKCILSFPSDRSIQTLRVIITGPEFGRSPTVQRKSIVLDNGLQHFIIGNDSFIYKAEVPAYVITVQYPKTGMWNLTFERKSGLTEPVVVIVRATSTRYGDIINMQSWISSDVNKQQVDNSGKPPITVFAEIKKNNNPLTDVKVTALIQPESYNTEWSLELKDGGDGDPDITKDDGIFSRYLTNIKESGYYSITVSAQKNSPLKYYDHANEGSKEINCCGSFIPDYLSFDSGSFKRVTTYQSFYVSKEKIGKTYPPRRVVDLRVETTVMLSNNKECYVLNWTAPGENYDNGKAFSYDIRAFNSREDALNDFDNSYVSKIDMMDIEGPLLTPEEAGTNQSALVELRNLTSGTYFIALKAISHSGKTSDVSNVVELSHTELYPLYTGTGFSNGEYFTFPIYGTTAITIKDEQKEGPSKFALAIGLTCGFLFLFIIIGLILLVYFGRRKKTKKDQSTPLGQNTKKTESNDALCHTNGGGNISIISPVNSWGADSLISHFQTIRQQKNNGENGMSSIPESREETDSISLSSSKFSYDNKIEQNSAIYDPIYYHQTRSQDELNYSYNPMYTPFDPSYTSSLRRLDNGDMVLNPYAADNISYSSYSLQRNQSSRLKTDV